jgi:hypothetical protein
VTFPHVLSAVIVPLGIGLAAGFVVGVITGVASTLRWIESRRRQGKLVPIYRDDTNPNPGHVPWRGDEHLSKFGWLLAIMGTLATIGSVVSLVQNNDTSNCLREYIERSSATNQQRAAGNDIDRQGISTLLTVNREFNQVLIDSITNPVTDPAAREAQRQDFVIKANEWNAQLDEADRLRREAERLRQENPLPAPPDCS